MRRGIELGFSFIRDCCAQMARTDIALCEGRKRDVRATLEDSPRRGLMNGAADSDPAFELVFYTSAHKTALTCPPDV